MRAVDFTLAMPFLLVALVVVVVFGQSLELIIVLLILFGWDNFARVVRAETLTLRESDYVSYARIQGASQWRILFRHILPGVVGSVLVIGSLRVGSLILTESTLSFLGVGVPPDTPAWGIMASDGRQHLSRAWWIATMPGIAIFLVVMGFNFLGDWLRDWFDPRLRQLRTN
jgi:peptide/nickel transport system permease protein